MNYFLWHAIRYHWKLLLLIALYKVFFLRCQGVCYMFSDEVSNNWQTSTNHHLVHLVDCTDLDYSMVRLHSSPSINSMFLHYSFVQLRKVPLFWSSQSDTGISRSPVLLWKMAWRWSLSNRLFHRGKCHILLLVSTTSDFHLLHHDLDEGLKQIHSNWKQRCSAGTNAATVQGIKVVIHSLNTKLNSFTHLFYRRSKLSKCWSL